MPRKENVAGAGMVIFTDLEEHVGRVLPRLRDLAPHRLIVRERVELEKGSLD